MFVTNKRIAALLAMFMFVITIYANVHPVKKVLIVGDSMTGWLGERINEHAKQNGYEVMTIVWDGATISKYASSGLSNFVQSHNPDAVIVCLGMNEMLGSNFSTKLKPSLDRFMKAFGNRPVLWVGPPTWPGRGDGAEFNKFMKNELGENVYFDSSSLKLPRQSGKNPHPTRAGMNKLADEVMKFNESHNALHLPGYIHPVSGSSSRSKVFIYKKMKERF